MGDMSPRDLSSKGYSLFLRRIASVKAGDVAKEIGWSDSRLSELKTKHTEDVLVLLAHLGLKVVPADMKVMPADAFAFLTKTHQRVAVSSPELIWGEVEGESGWGGLN